VAHKVVRRGACRILVGKTEVQRPFGRCRHKCQDNIKTDYKKIGGSAWTGLIQAKIRTRGLVVVKTMVDFLVP
jgi:hypothetical protein